MRAFHDVERAAATIAGEVALPRPTGRAEDLRHAARTLERAAARARATTTVHGTLAPRLRAVWSGDAATEAGAEADELGRRARGVVDALPAAARSLESYAAALDRALGRVRSLQRQWDALDADHLLAVMHAVGGPDPTGVLVSARRQRADEDRLVGRVRLSRAYALVVDELELAARRCGQRVASITDSTLPQRVTASPSTVSAAVTGGLWFADGVVACRASREAALADAAHLRRALPPTPSEGSGVDLRDADVAGFVARARAHVDDPVYAQALLEELGADGLGRLVLEAGTPSADVRVETVRALVGTMGSVVVTATQHSAPAGTDPRTRAQLARGAALLADEVVASATTTVADSGAEHRAAGYWLLGQLLAGARASGDTRPLPGRLVRRAAAAPATAEIAEVRDTDADLRHGTTIRPDGHAAFASWLDDADSSGDALHILLQEVGDDPEDQAALLAEPLPYSAVAGGALANARGDRLTLGEHLVRRWITYEVNGTETRQDLRLATDRDLDRLLHSVSTTTTSEAAETRARLMLELSRTSSFAMGEASTTRIYSRGTGAVERQVAAWLSAMHATVDRALASPLFGPRGGYAAATASGPQPTLDAHELTGVVAALAVDTGMGLQAKATAATYDRLLETELEHTRQSAAAGLDVRSDVVRLGFFDQAASAALVQVAHRQDELNRGAWRGLAEAWHVVDEIRRGGPAGLASMVQRYAQAGTMRTPTDDLAIAVVRSDVELRQTELDDTRRAVLLARVDALVGGRGTVDVGESLAAGASRATSVPTAEALRAARTAEIRKAWDAVRESAVQRLAENAPRPTRRPDDRLHVAEGRDGRLPELDQLPRGKNATTKVVDSERDLRDLFGTMTRDAARLDPGTYPGTRWLREDGVEVRLRETSTSGGATIELVFPDGSWRKVHIR